jgi:type IV pilus assembly protein PilE
MRTQPAAGFTLIEMVVVATIVAILAAIAYPGYQEHVRKSRRTDARNILLEAAQRQERFYTERNQYTTALGDGGLNFSPMTGTTYRTPDGFYDLTLATTTAAGRVSTYVLTATPVTGKGQDKDTACGAFSINQLGVKCILGGSKCSNVAAQQADVAKCW